MGKDKSIQKKIADTIKDIVTIATDAANQALKAEESPIKADERSAAYIPLAADGLVSDPMMVPPVAAAPAPGRKRAAPKRAASKASKKTARKAARKSADRTEKRSASKRSERATKKIAKKASRKAAKQARKGSRRRT
jgi:hypothetical protein